MRVFVGLECFCMYIPYGCVSAILTERVYQLCIFRLLFVLVAACVLVYLKSTGILLKNCGKASMQGVFVLHIWLLP